MSEYYTIHRNFVPRDLCLAARRHILMHIPRRGLAVHEINLFQGEGWFPEIDSAPPLEAIKALLPPADIWVPTQILIRFPDPIPSEEHPPHVDAIPWWAREQGLRHGAIYGVELTDTEDGGGHTVIRAGEEPEVVKLKTGDMVEYMPDQMHSGSPNYSADLRMALFFRTLVQA